MVEAAENRRDVPPGKFPRSNRHFRGAALGRGGGKPMSRDTGSAGQVVISAEQRMAEAAAEEEQEEESVARLRVDVDCRRDEDGV